ncbi:MAG: hypothetical protein R3B98_05950 [Hyphomonas sp.]
MDAIREAIAALQQETAAYPPGVHIWMNVMMVTFFSSIVFVTKKPGARWILAAVLVNIAGLILIKAAMPGLAREQIGTGIHLVFWTFALAMIWRPALRRRRRAEPATAYHRIYGAWLVVASLVMAASLALDARAALGWLF